MQGGKGPIFEDGPGFDSAFKLFHGKDGILQFNPLAGKVATISLSAFGPGGPFGFGPFSEKWKKQQKKPKPSKNQQVGFDRLCKTLEFYKELLFLISFCLIACLL